MNKAFWKFIFPHDVRRVEATGTQAREKAERDLAEVQQELAKTREQTPYYAGLGMALRVERERNHIADRIRATMREA